MNSSLYILLLSPHQVDDVLFVQALARTLGKGSGGAPPMMIVHGSGEAAERRLEGEGLYAVRLDGKLVVRSPQEAQWVEQAVRESNRKLVSVLNDAVVHAVGFQGTDRRLLRVEENGTVTAPGAGWVLDLAFKGAVPVIAGVVFDRPAGFTREVGPAETAVALGKHYAGQEVTIVFFSTPNSMSKPGEQGLQPEVTVEQVEALGSVQDAGSLHRVVTSGLPVMVAGVTSFLTPEGASGTRVVT
jgi:acetylglutamate kinase